MTVAEECIADFERRRKRTKRNGNAEAPRDNGLPVLIIDDNDHTAAAKRLAQLIAAREDFLFNGHGLIRVVSEGNDMPRALAVTTESVRVLAHKICNPVKQTAKGGKPTAIKADIANLYLNGLEGEWGLKPFRGITTSPILSNDGSIRVASGYDPATGLWCHDIPALDVPETPDGREAKAALERIRFRFRTFPFADGERIRDPALGVDVIDPSKRIGLDESSFLAALLTGVCRQSLELAPGFLCNAPAYSGAGTGKGKLVKAICIVASGATPAAFTSGHNTEELDKRLTAALIAAHPAVFLDNFNAKELRSDILASALTENPAQVRPMGQTVMVPLHVCTLITISGNAVEIAEDIARRLIETFLDAKTENPEERKFAPGFLDEILVARPDILSDALIIWRFGRQNPGALTEGRSLGSYEVWCQWIRDPLLTLGCRDPVDRLAEIKANDPRRRMLVSIFEIWWTVHRDQMMQAKDLAPEVLEQIFPKAARNPEGKLQVSRQQVVGFLTKHAGAYVGGYSLGKVNLGSGQRPDFHYKLTNSNPKKEAA
jgi:hypothetical protein